MPLQPNLNYIKAIAAGDKAFEHKIIQILKEEFPKEQKQYYLKLTKKQYPEIAFSVHKLKHKISLLGLEKSFRLAGKYEQALKRNELKHNVEFEHILKCIAQFLSTL